MVIKSKKLRVLFVSRELIAGDLAYKLTQEGCDVKLFIQDKLEKDCFENMVPKTNNWLRELTWVGKNGLIVFDDVGYGKIQDDLKKKGYLIIGGGIKGDQLELDREYGQKVLKKSGVTKNYFKTENFNVELAIKFVKKNRGQWVIKNASHNTVLSYVGKKEDGSDVLDILESYRKQFGKSINVSLQKKVSGIEIAIGRFFNGKNWVGPSVINFEHKHFSNDDIGPLGGETGTLMWYEKDEQNKLFRRTLYKIKPYLEKINYKGYIDVNCIVYKNKLYPLEVTSRFGSATIETQEEIHISKWCDFLFALAKGEDYSLKYKSGYAINVALTVPPFPYRTSDKTLASDGVRIHFENFTKKDWPHIHYEGVTKTKNGNLEVCGKAGYVLYITGIGRNIKQVRKNVYRIIEKTFIPKMFYRTDIGVRFEKKDKKLLRKWGWI